MTTLKNGCVTVNMGEVRSFGDFEVEVLSPSISGHGANIVCTYFVNNNRNKVELTYFEDGDNKGHEVYYFKHHTDVQHYTSRIYRETTLPKAYAVIAARLRTIHAEVFANA